jgi:hypothetical protein
VTVDPSGNALVIWSHRKTNPVSGIDHVLYARRYTVGSGWGTTLTLAQMNVADVFASGISAFSIGADGSGNAIAVWSQWDGARYNVQAKRYITGSGWEMTASLVSSGMDSTSLPRIAVAANGDAMVIWSQSDGLWSNHFTLADSWGMAPEQLDAAGTNVTPDIAIDASGNAIAVWNNASGLQAKYFDASGGWEMTPVVIQTGSDAAYSPHVGFDGSGNALAMWLQDGDNSAAVRLDVTLNHYDVNMHSWGTAQNFPTLNGGASPSPNGTFIKHAVDAAGNALVIWNDTSNGPYQLKTNRYMGGTSWGTTTTLSNTTFGDVAVAAAGNGFTVWQCEDPDVGTICSRTYAPMTGWSAMAAHNTKWTIFGSTTPVLSSNAAGKAFVAWSELGWMAAYRFP